MYKGLVLAAANPAPLVSADRAGHVHAARNLLNGGLALGASICLALLAYHVPLVGLSLADFTGVPRLLAVLAKGLVACTAICH